MHNLNIEEREKSLLLAVSCSDQLYTIISIIYFMGVKDYQNSF
jgi:hypothetical protein